MSKVCTDEGDIKWLYRGLSACTGDHQFTKACGLSPPTDRQTLSGLLHIHTVYVHVFLISLDITYPVK